MSILDLGCGKGINIDFFKAGNGTVFGLDISLASLSEAARSFPQRKLLCGSGESIPFRDCSMDAVVSNVALCYMDIPKALREINRVLVPGGTLAATLHYFAFSRSN